MRIKFHKGRALELLRALVDQQLAHYWLKPETLAAALVHQPANPGPTTLELFTDAACTTRLDASTVRRRAVLLPKAKDESTFTIIGALNLPAPLDKGPMILVTSDFAPILASEADAALYPDGVVQIYGAEPEIMLQSLQQLIGQIGRKMFRGTGLDGFYTEELDLDGKWTRTDHELRLPHGVIRAFEV